MKRRTMETKILLLILAGTLLSGCYFLDYVIPEEYIDGPSRKSGNYNYDEPRQNNRYESTIWLMHSHAHYNSIGAAISDLNRESIPVLSSYVRGGTYYVKICKSDYERARRLGWSQMPT